MHSVNFLLVIPEFFQIILINIFLLFAICFSYYRKNTKVAVTPSSSFGTSEEGRENNWEKIVRGKIKSPSEGSTLESSLTTEKKSSINSISRKIEHFPDIEQKETVHISDAYFPTPVALIEPIIQLIILVLVCCSLLYINNPLTYAVGLTDSIIWDNLSRFMSTLLCVSAGISLMLGLAAIKRYGRYEFVFIIWLSIIGMLCLLKSYNFLTFYLSIELQSLSFYMLAAMRSKTEASAEAGLKYFILSAFSSAILLLGITLIYSSIGSQNFADLSVIINYSTAVQLQIYPISLAIGLGCVCVSLLFKLAAAPFHLWVADVYEGSPTPITAFFAITAKISAATALIRILEFHVTTQGQLLPFIAILSLVIGSLSAMRQVKLKRLIAFSGVANVGWFLLALITGQWDLLIIHLIVYILLSICLFSIFVLPLFRTHPNLEYRQRVYAQSNIDHAVDYGADSLTIKYISDLNQLNKTNPSLALAMVVAFFSLAGIPPFAGFYSKYLIINALTQTEQYLTLSVALGSAILSAFYYIRVIKTVYFTSAGVSYSVNPKLAKSNAFKKLVSSKIDIPYSIPPRINRSVDKLKMFTIMPISLNAYICALSTILTVLFFIKPDYIFACIALSQ